MSLCLSKEELRELAGYKQKSKVARWLRTNGFRSRMGADGWPRLDRTIYERVMSGANTSRKDAEPNFTEVL